MSSRKARLGGEGPSRRSWFCRVVFFPPAVVPCADEGRTQLPGTGSDSTLPAAWRLGELSSLDPTLPPFCSIEATTVHLFAALGPLLPPA